FAQWCLDLRLRQCGETHEPAVRRHRADAFAHGHDAQRQGAGHRRDRFSDLAGSTTPGTSTYAYDAAGRRTGSTHKDGSSTVLTQATYAYDAANRITSETVDAATKTYTYDNADQLVSAGADAYSYDAAGNRNMSGWTVGTNNRLTNDGTWTYTYDAEM